MALLPACHTEKIEERDRVVFVDGKEADDVHEVFRKNAEGGELVQRFHKIVGVKDAAMSLAELDAEGFVLSASYRREGPSGKRYVELRRWDKGGENQGKIVMFSRGDDETLVLPDKSVVVLDVLHHLHPTRARDVTLVDLEDAVFIPARVTAGGALTDPAGRPLVVDGAVGGRAERDAGAPGASNALTAGAPPAGAVLVTAADPVQPRDTARAPFIESSTRSVVRWCKLQAGVDAPVLDAARAVALAVKPRLAAERGAGPPSALWTVKVGAYDQGGAALVVACMRALGHPARVVSGVAGDGLTAGAARTWAQVHDGAAWVDVDPLDIDVDGNGHEAHHAVVEGFPGPLTTGLAPPSPGNTPAGAVDAAAGEGHP